MNPSLVAVSLEVEPRLCGRVGGVLAEVVGVGAVVVRLEVGPRGDGRLDALHPLAGVQLKGGEVSKNTSSIKLEVT